MGEGLLSGFLVISFSILLTWLVVAATFVGVGLGVQRMFGVTRIDADRCIAAFWIGFAVGIAFLQLWHLALPITVYCLIIMIVAGAAGLWWNRRGVRGWARGWARGVPPSIWFLLAAVWVANHAAGPCTAWDSGMYHVQAVRWNVTYPIVPGLGNLEGQLAFNNSSLLYAAMLGVGPWSGGANHLANGLLVLILFVQIILSAIRMIRSDDRSIAKYSFDLFLLAPVIGIIVSEGISSLTTDVPPAVVLFVAASRLYAWLVTAEEERRKNLYDLVVTGTLLILAICLKTSSILFVPIAMIVALWPLRKLSAADRSLVLRWISGIACLLIVPFLIRGVILSGYPLYPSNIGAISFSWRMPIEFIDAQRTWLTLSARRSLLPGWSWVPHWLHTMQHWPQAEEFYFGVALPCALAAIACFFRFKGQRGIHGQGRPGWWVALPALVGIPIWFIAFPSPRFGFYLFWILAATCAAQAIEACREVKSRWFVAALLLTGFAIGGLPIIAPPINGWVRGNGRLVSGVTAQLLLRPGGARGLHSMPVAEIYRYTTRSGLTLNVPLRDTRCFDAPLPCTPYPAPNLVVKQGLGGRPMFATEGAWQQINWPNPEIYSRGLLRARKDH